MRVLVLEDNVCFLEVLRSSLSKTGYVVDTSNSILGFLELASLRAHNLYLVDLGLPDGDGVRLVQTLRSRKCSTPIIISTARSQVRDRVLGLDAGADDYLVKPYHLSELLARINAVLRRPIQLEPDQIRKGAIVVDRLTNQISCNGVRIQLTPSEHRLLLLLLKRAGSVVSKAAIESALQSANAETSPNAVEKLVSRLRKALDQQPAGVALKTVKGVGYVLEEHGT